VMAAMERRCVVSGLRRCQTIKNGIYSWSEELLWPGG
jgi:hypothetical protein